MASAKKKHKADPSEKKNIESKGRSPRFDTQKKEKAAPKERKRIRPKEENIMPLNKYLAHSGVGSRKEAVAKIKDGLVEVNGESMLNPAHKVSSKDIVRYKGQVIKPKTVLSYLLVNKPKSMGIGRMDSSKRDVYTIIEEATKEAVYPVGGLPKKYAGLLLMTNDGDLNEQLGNPNNLVEQLYKISLDKELSEEDMEKIRSNALELELPLHIIDIQYADGQNKKEIGLQLKNNQPKILDTIFRSLGYEVLFADRVLLAGLSKKNLSRGFYRHLKSTEIVKLKHFNKYTDA